VKRIKRLGLSTVISNLLLLSIVAVIGTSILVWTVTGYSSYQNEVLLYLSSRSEAVNESFIIEHAWFRDTDSNDLYDQAKLYIRNIGEYILDVDAVYIEGSAVSETSPTLPLSLGLDESSELTVTLSSEVPEGTTLRIEAVSGRGNVFTVYFEAG